jgi:amidase
MYEYARTHTTLDYLNAMGRLEQVGRSVVRFASAYDFLLTPALARRPVPTGEIHGRGPDPWGHYRRSGAFTPYTAIVNVTGLPAISLPLYLGADGLPAAVQLIGGPAGEEALLSLARQLELASPWADRRPPGF